MPPPPPLAYVRRVNADGEHVRLLAVFYFVMAGLSVLGVGFLFFHYMMFSAIFESGLMDQAGKAEGVELAGVFGMMKWMYVFWGVICVVGGVLDFLCGRFLLAKRNRMFCMVVAGVNCLSFPLGTALGVFTFIVLGRDSVRVMFEGGE